MHRMTFDLPSLAPGLERRADGIWFARRQAPVSYPEHGNAACLQIEDRSFWFRHRNRCIASVVTGRFILFIGRFMFFIDHDEPQVFCGRE